MMEASEVSNEDTARDDTRLGVVAMTASPIPRSARARLERPHLLFFDEAEDVSSTTMASSMTIPPQHQRQHGDAVRGKMSARIMPNVAMTRSEWLCRR